MSENTIDISREDLYAFGQDFWSRFGTAILIGLGVILLLGLLQYLLKSFGVMKMAKNMKIPNSWMAWVPIASEYLLGQIAFEDRNKALLLLGLNFAPIISSLIFGQSAVIIISTAIQCFYYYALYQIYKKRSDKAVMMLIFSILSCGMLIPIFLFAIRNNEVKIENNEQ